MNRRLQAEVDTFNRLIEHQAEKGRENELSLAHVIEGLIPRKFGVGTGLLIDAKGRYSKQIDIVVYDQADEPALMAQTNQTLFPVENVRLCIEVKTSVGKDEIEDAQEKYESILNLVSKSNGHPVFTLVGYQGTQKAETLAGHLRAAAPVTLDFACVLQLGLFACKSDFAAAAAVGQGYVTGVTPLLELRNGSRTTGIYVHAPEDDTGAQALYLGNRYPVVQLPDGDYLAEPSRALLLFCEALLNSLQEDGESILSHYLTPAGRDLLLF